MRRLLHAALLGAATLAALAGCKSNYSPDTYASGAVQQANPVDQGVVVGAREVGVSADTTVGVVTGAAAGGVAGSQVGGGVTSAFGAIGGGLLGGLAGSAAQHVEGDAQAYEYIVRKTKGDLISVTQQDKTPLKVGDHVLVIAGKQARIVPDYTVPVTPQSGGSAEAPTVPVPAVPVPAVPTPPTVAVPPVPAPPAPPPVLPPATPVSASSQTGTDATVAIAPAPPPNTAATASQPPTTAAPPQAAPVPSSTPAPPVATAPTPLLPPTAPAKP
jgi:outer membrane lipoprotein SlyB